MASPSSKDAAPSDDVGSETMDPSLPLKTSMGVHSNEQGNDDSAEPSHAQPLMLLTSIPDNRPPPSVMPRISSELRRELLSASSAAEEPTMEKPDLKDPSKEEPAATIIDSHTDTSPTAATNKTTPRPRATQRMSFPIHNTISSLQTISEELALSVDAPAKEPTLQPLNTAGPYTEISEKAESNAVNSDRTNEPSGRKRTRINPAKYDNSMMMSPVALRRKKSLETSKRREEQLIRKLKEEGASKCQEEQIRLLQLKQQQELGVRQTAAFIAARSNRHKYLLKKARIAGPSQHNVGDVTLTKVRSSTTWGEHSVATASTQSGSTFSNNPVCTTNDLSTNRQCDKDTDNLTKTTTKKTNTTTKTGKRRLIPDLAPYRNNQSSNNNDDDDDMSDILPITQPRSSRRQQGGDWFHFTNYYSRKFGLALSITMFGLLMVIGIILVFVI